MLTPSEFLEKLAAIAPPGSCPFGSMGRSVCAEFTASAESYFEVRDDLAKRTLTTDDFV